jgi:acyl-CoA dehydrogenase
MRSIGVAERALERMIRRLNARVAFGKTVAEQGVWRERIAESRIMIDQARLLCLHAAHLMDTAGNKHARAEIAMIKIIAPSMACKILDWAIQAFGGGGMTDTWLAMAYAHQRSLRLADGPDEVHRDQLARLVQHGINNSDPARSGGWAEVMVADGLSHPGLPL